MPSRFRQRFLFILVLVVLGVLARAASSGSGKSFGEDKAPLTIEVFSDFQCSACATYHLTTLRSIMDADVAQGRVFLIFHIITPGRAAYRSYSAARFGNAAARIGKFREVSEALFSKQKEWSETGDVEGVVASALTPEEMARVRELIRTENLDNAVEADMVMARVHGVRATPTTIIRYGGKITPVVGAVSYSILRRYLDRLLEEGK
jgi:protein-disulfide isomerase